MVAAALRGEGIRAYRTWLIQAGSTWDVGSMLSARGLFKMTRTQLWVML